MHGYQLYEFIERSLSFCTDLKKPTAYYLLSRMAQDGLLLETVSQEGNRPPRKVYQLTPAGEAAFQDFLRQNLSSFTAARFPGDIGLAFLEDLEYQLSNLAVDKDYLNRLAEGVDDGGTVAA